jgi:hypothetical protein
VKLGETDLTDLAFPVGKDDIEGLEVSVTRRQTRVQGTVKNQDGARLNGVTVLAFPVERKYQIRNSRRVLASRTTLAGEYDITGLPPGTYALAVVDAPQYEPTLHDPAFFAALRPASTVTLAAGESKTHSFVVRQ